MKGRAGTPEEDEGGRKMKCPVCEQEMEREPHIKNENRSAMTI